MLKDLHRNGDVIFVVEMSCELKCFVFRVSDPTGSNASANDVKDWQAPLIMVFLEHLQSATEKNPLSVDRCFLSHHVVGCCVLY